MLGMANTTAELMRDGKAAWQAAASAPTQWSPPHACQAVDQHLPWKMMIVGAQERPEDVPTGELPRSMQLLVDRRLVGTVSPGTRVTATGIYRIISA